jgi:hypothetical protein
MAIYHVPMWPSDKVSTHDTTRHDTTRHDTTRHDTTRHDTTRHTIIISAADFVSPD